MSHFSNENDPYESFKRGVKRDAISTGINLAGGLGFFFFLWFLLMVLWYGVASKSGASEVGRILAFGFLAVVVPCLFFKRTANFILNIWGTVLVLLVGGILVIPLLYIAYICFGTAFELI